MNYRYGNLMDSLAEYQSVFITTNSCIKKTGELVMGRGFAKSCAVAFPELALKAGEAIGSDNKYGIIEDVLIDSCISIGDTHTTRRKISLGLFQVKFNWRDNATLELVKYSTEMLKKLALTNSQVSYALNYPAIGNGHLSKQDIEPIIETLPDNVDVWQYEVQK